MNNSDISEIINGYSHLIVDSRAVYDPCNTIFAAIRTDVGDGHRYVRGLYGQGVKAFIVEYIPEDCRDIDARFFVVDDVQAALGEIAYARIRGNEGGIVVTGSCGKTTMKELLYRALLQYADVRCSPRSWNSGIGLPLAIWDMTSGTKKADWFITEAGIDAPGQAVFIRSVISNTHHVGVLTPITGEHDEAFISHADKVREKLAILSACRTVVYDASDPGTDVLVKEWHDQWLKAGRQMALVPVVRGGFVSIYHAIADRVLDILGFSPEQRLHVPSLPIADKRREISAGNFGNIIVRDRFTADLRSLRDALDFMRRHATPTHPRVLALGRLLAPKDANPDEIRAEAKHMAAQFGVDVLDIDRAAPDLLVRYHRGELLRDRQVLVFGEPDKPLVDFAEALESAGHDTTLEVDLDAIVHNYNHYRSLVPPGTGIIAMVKASAYGMGAVEIGKILQSHGAAALAVAVIEEGIALREAGISMPVMVLNPVTNRYPALFSHRLEPAVFSIDELDRLIEEAGKAGVKEYPVHVKLDTGMHRVGFLAADLDAIAARIAATDAVKVKSVFSHLATADCLDMDEYTEAQLELFRCMTDALREKLGYSFFRHILNTAGMMRFASCGNYEMARLGIGLYGISPYEGSDGDALKPVAAFRSHIISLKHWPAGTPVGYGCKGRTVETDSIVATVPVGYADGVNRRLGGGRASFVVKGVECPTIGNICMDLCMVDVSAVPDVAVGDAVEIFGPSMTVGRLAKTLGTIPYEVLTSVSPRVKRVYVRK